MSKYSLLREYVKSNGKGLMKLFSMKSEIYLTIP